MIKESCNLIGQEHILKSFKSSFNIWGKKNFFHRIQLILHYVLLLMRHTQPAVVVLHAFFLGYYLYEKIYDIDCFFLEIFMIKESFNFIGRKHILVHNLKLCELN